MRILLIYPDLNIHVNYPVGLGLISACLKRAGHDTRVIHLNEELGFPMDIPKIKNIVDEFSPELIAFSSTTSQFKYVKALSATLKKHTGAPIVCGGIHATVIPKEVLDSGVVDFVCLGEGEEAMVELVDRMEKGEDYRDVKNLGFIRNGEIIVNPLRPLVRNLDELPFPDRESFDFGKIVALKNGWANIMAGRGCLYQCAYCVNNYFHKLYREMGARKDHLRIRKVDTVIREVQELVERYENIRLINFDDDLFTMFKDWLAEFCDAYKREIQLPFACNVQVRHFDEKRAKMLYDAGCREVKIGLESGNEEIRKNILKRSTPDDVLIRAFKIAENTGLRSWAFNMVGFPTETASMIMDTVRINAKIRPYILRCSIFYPYKGTELYRYCDENNLLDDSKKEAYSSYMEGSVLKLKDLSQSEIIKAKQLFKWLVDSESDIETSGFYKMLINYFDQLPPESWLNDEAQDMVKQFDEVLDKLFRILKKEHYTSRKHLYLNYTERNNFELP